MYENNKDIYKTMKQIFFISYYITLIIIFFLKINFCNNNKKKVLHIEIIIPGSSLYNPIDIFKKTEPELWEYRNLKEIHQKETSKLKINISSPMLTEIELSESCNNYFNKTQQYFKNKDIDCKFFFFNWPGKRTTDHFFYAAKILYLEIKKIKSKLEEEYNQIEISIIGYSHGGNIAIIMTHWIVKNNDNETIIDYIFLFGTPIGKITLNHINAKNNKNKFIIKKIINLYNPEDWIQTFDRNFDLFCKQEIPITRKNIKNIIVMKNNKDFKKVNQNFFKKGYSLHMFYLEEEFLCQEFFKIKNKF